MDGKNNMYEVRIEKHWSGKTYNVNLISWQGDEGVSFGRAFDVSKQKAEKEAKENADLYNAKIIRKY
tara:strand:+ start:125 stop:325 length:201 start_codon:yes stop_codon:yes gene_type:complete